MKRFLRILFGRGTSEDYVFRIIGDANHLNKRDLRDMAEYIKELNLSEQHKIDDWNHLQEERCQKLS
jgi:hypothetical protein